jgi:hypothetical protein
MNRRHFLKSLGAAGASVLMPSSLNLMSMYKSANAAINYAATSVVAPAIMPQVINIFLYGGPSELSGNLTNIVDIENNSQLSYANSFGSRILTFDTDGTAANGFITKNGFWRGTPNVDQPFRDDNGAGGRDMQFLLDEGHMSVYRNLFKRLDPTRSHRESILMSLKGSLDIDISAGIGTKLAASIYQNRALYQNNTVLADGTAIADIVNNLLLPFVSFEGETRAFAPDPDTQIPLLLRGTTLDTNFGNPYSRTGNESYDTLLNDLTSKVVTAADQQRFAGVVNSFALREYLSDQFSGILAAKNTPLPLVTEAQDAAALGININDPLYYPNNQYSARIQAAVTLAIANPASLYITVGGDLGGWDDHNNAIDKYRQRMNDLFATLKSAMLHIKYADQSRGATTTINGTTRSSDNIVINMFGDFGRRANLNNSEGWDHGNNQNLYTFGGAALRPAGALGKVVGQTMRVGTGGTNDQVTEPVSGSYDAEPMSVAATVFSYFGVQNPQILTADSVINPAGVPAIDETHTGESPLF